MIWFCIGVVRSIPSQGNTAEIGLQVLHRNFLGMDEFLGQASIPLADFDVYERPKNRYIGQAGMGATSVRSVSSRVAFIFRI